jgi:hypothetical protein
LLSLRVAAINMLPVGFVAAGFVAQGDALGNGRARFWRIGCAKFPALIPAG